MVDGQKAQSAPVFESGTQARRCTAQQAGQARQKRSDAEGNFKNLAFRHGYPVRIARCVKMVWSGQRGGPAMQRAHRGVNKDTGLGQQRPEATVQVPAAHAKRCQQCALKITSGSHKACKFGSHEGRGNCGSGYAGGIVGKGGIGIEDALDIVGIDGVTVGDELRRIGYAGGAPLPGRAPHAFVEVHVEQGPVLEAEGLTIGAVTGVQGISWQEVTISGQSNHAGTTPTSMRHDAGFAAFAIGAFVRGLAIEIGPPQVGTVGKIDLEPNLVNVVARTARLTVDLRNTDETEFQSAESKLVACLDELAEREGVTIERRTLARFEPVAFDDRMIDLVEATAERLGLKVRRLPSGAGHDAQMMARICPTAMVFVPSVGGISHNPAEYTSPGDLTAGAQVLLEVMCRLASRTTDPDQLYEM